jgi:hypothetical protein
MSKQKMLLEKLNLVDHNEGFSRSKNQLCFKKWGGVGIKSHSKDCLEQ